MINDYFMLDKEERKQLEKYKTEKVKEILKQYGDKKHKLIEMKEELKYISLDYAEYPSYIYDNIKVQTSRNHNQIEKAAISSIEKEEALKLKIKEYEREINSMDFTLNLIEPLDTKIIKSRFIQGKSIQKVANEVGLPPSRVNTRIKKILHDLTILLL